MVFFPRENTNDGPPAKAKVRRRARGELKERAKDLPRVPLKLCEAIVECINLTLATTNVD